MQITRFTDYSFRVLIYLVQHPDGRVTIDHLNDYFEVSRNHLVKVVHWLSQQGYVETRRGKGGGIVLAVPAEEIQVGVLFRQAERLDLVECFDPPRNRCKITDRCGLQGVIRRGLAEFVKVLDGYTLADVAGSNAAGVGIPRQFSR